MGVIDNGKTLRCSRRRLLHGLGRGLALGGLLLWGVHANAQSAPSAPASSAGNYTVSFPSCNGCYQQWLEEKVGDSGTWTYISQASISFSNKPAGRYYYRVGQYWFDSSYYYGGGGAGWTSYGAQTVVTVGAAVTADPLERQLTYRYEVRRGDLNGDGRADLFVNRTSGGTAGNGALDRAILLQQSTGRFTSLLPSAAQAYSAKSWPTAAAQAELRDVNADGYVDIIVKNVATAVGAAAAMNQIVFSPGRSSLTNAPTLRSVDARLKQFASNVYAYLGNANHFADHAPVRVVTVTYYDVLCQYNYGYGDFTSFDPQNCYWAPYQVTTVIRDYSVFDPSAVSIWTQEASIYGNSQTRSRGLDSIESTVEQMIGAPVGGWDLYGKRGELGSLDEPEYKRGFELFIALLGIGTANAQEAPRRTDTVYVTGRRVIGWLPSTHTALEYNRSTISAYDSDNRTLSNGVLVSEKNWSGDLPHLMMTLGTATRSSTAAAAYWVQLLAADTRYDDNLPYSPIPSAGQGRYNSNGYVRGIITATGGTTNVNMASLPGGKAPVPASVFN